MLTSGGTNPVISATQTGDTIVDVLVTDNTPDGPLELRVDIDLDGSIDMTEYVEIDNVHIVDFYGYIPAGGTADVEFIVIEHAVSEGTQTRQASQILTVHNTLILNSEIESTNAGPGQVTGTLSSGGSETSTELLFRGSDQTEWRSGGFVADSFSLTLNDADGARDYELMAVTYEGGETHYSSVVTVYDVPPPESESTGTSDPNSGSSSGEEEEEDEFWSEYPYGP
ncbi:MAG: hypothetical protein Fues2KO_18650 [Fuerstiella sp.]